MGRVLSGAELVGFIKERQARQVRNLRQEHGVTPRLCIIQSVDASPVIDTYVRVKRRYADDILITVDIVKRDAHMMYDAIAEANADKTVHGVIVQLPIDQPELTDDIVAGIASAKDVDGLGPSADFVSATAEAIDWLVAGYNLQMAGKQIAIIGRGRLVGGPLERLWMGRGLSVRSFDRDDFDASYVRTSDVIVTATGAPGSLTNDLIKANATVIDAGTASEAGVVVGDIDSSVRERTDITVTPEKGGVGPLTVAVMFDHVIQSALRSVGKL